MVIVLEQKPEQKMVRMFERRQETKMVIVLELRQEPKMMEIREQKPAQKMGIMDGEMVISLPQEDLVAIIMLKTAIEIEDTSIS